MPYHEDQLPDLPTPEQAPTLMANLLEQMGPRWSWQKGINYDAGPLDLRLSNKGLMAQGLLGPMQIDGRLKMGGDWNLNGAMPLMGGLLNLGASRNDGNDAYQLRYQRSFY